MLEGFRKEDLPTFKKLPVEVDVPEFLCMLGLMWGATALASATGDLALIAFYFLWRVGEYTIKGSRNNSKQTVQFRMKDILFFHRNELGQLHQLSLRRAPDEALLGACGTTFKLDNQKNGWKNVCVHHEANGDPHYCPVRAAARRFIHIRKHMCNNWDNVTDRDISLGLKTAAMSLNYPVEKDISIDRIDTHLYAVVAQMRCHWLGTRIGKYRKWEDGVARRSWSTFGRSWHASPRACPEI